MFKVDFFVLREERFHAECFLRRRLERVELGSKFQAYVETPEDTALSKLTRYKRGGVSENQWRDVLGILKAQAGRLDVSHMQKWAPELEVADLLNRAFAEAGLPLNK